ncbi:MAG: hypothetical protein PHU27_06820 [Salinivirgaceae bacterium]|nr:hypothetical protein [Salinivirgaceae bacterium]
MKNGDINSINHLIIIDPQIGNRLKNKNNNRIPLPLITHLISNNGNVIDYEIPITGSFKNPKFRWNDLVTNVFQNILMETPTMHYREQIKTIEIEIENSHTLKWEMLQTALSKKQEHFVKDIATHLLKNPNTSIEIFPTLYTEKEKEYMGVFEAKKKFFLHSKSKDLQLFSFNDSINVAQMSMRDSMFLEYLNEQMKDVSMVTIQEKCNSLVGQINIDLKLQQLCEKRENDVLLHFKKKGVANRVQIHPVKNTIPFNGFSFYEIRYNGKMPKSLVDATRKLDKLKSQPLSKETP